MGKVTRLTDHAKTRMAQRGIRENDLEIAFRFGQVHYSAGAEHIFLGKSNLPQDLQGRYSHLVGTTIVFAEGVVVTTYKNRRALSEIKRKAKFFRAAA